jgi:hypothetical protein
LGEEPDGFLPNVEQPASTRLIATNPTQGTMRTARPSELFGLLTWVHLNTGSASVQDYRTVPFLRQDFSKGRVKISP